MPTLATNRQAYRDYELLEKIEAGISLTGPEVKSLKNGSGQLKGSFVKITSKNEVFLIGCFISSYKHANNDEYDPNCPRKLLLHSQEIRHLSTSVNGENLTIVPLKLYTNRQGLIKLEIALAKGKKKHEKRKATQERDIKREIQRTLKKYR